MRRRQLLGAGVAAAAASAAGLSFGGWAAHAQRRLPLQPPPLRPGSRIAALAPGTWLEPGDPLLDQLEQRCRRQGWSLIRPAELQRRWRWFAGTDAQRAAALQQAWLDPEVDALFYVGAGWGSARVLEQGWRVPATRYTHEDESGRQADAHGKQETDHIACRLAHARAANVRACAVALVLLVA